MLNYLLQTGICWAIFLFLYGLLLQRETFFRLNRYYLLITLLLGLIIPGLDISLWSTSGGHTGTMAYYLQPITVGVQSLEQTIDTIVISPEDSRTFHWSWILQLLYWAGVLFFLFRTLLGLFQLYRLYHLSKIEPCQGYTLVKTPQKHSPFSFFYFLFWSQFLQVDEKEAAYIIRHEQAHIDQKHSLDILLLELLGILFWYLPPIHYYKKALRIVHEYLADAAVYDNSPKRQYGQLLLKQAQSGHQPALAHPIFHSQLKRRIIMMTKNKSNHRALIKYFGLLPLALFLLLAFSTDKNVVAARANDFSYTTFFPNPDPFDKAKVKNQLAAILVQLNQETTYEQRKAICASFEENYNTLQNQYPAYSDEIAQVAQSLIDKNNAPVFLQTGATFPQLKFMESSSGEAFNAVEEMPLFPGCEKLEAEKRQLCSQKALMGHVFSHIKYPKKASEAGITGTVVVRFVIDEKGKMTKPTIVQPIGGGCDEEVLRVMATLPDWIPGKHKGKAVKVEMNLPVKFTLDGAEKNVDKADQMPRFPGCEEEASEEAKQQCAVNKLIQFLGENLAYPEDAKAAGIEGVVLTRFVVDKNGLLQKPQTIKSIGYGCDEAVLEMIQKMNKEVGPWIPGQMKDGEKVNVFFNLPVSFRLSAADRAAVKNPVKSLSLENFKAFPNPVDDQLTLQFDAPAEPVQLDLSTLNGQQLTRLELPDFDGHYEGQLRTDQAPTGTLLLTIRQGEKVFVKKIAVQR